MADPPALSGSPGPMGLRWLPAYFVLAGATGILLALAFPQPGWGFLAHIALAPLVLLCLRAASVRRLAWTTYLVAVAWWLLMLRWLIPVTGGGYVAVSFFLGLYTPLAMLWLRWLHRRYRLPMVVALPMVWVSVEFLRGTLPAGGFGWFALSHTQAPYLPHHAAGRLIQVADLLGEHGVSLLVAMTNGMVVDLLNLPLVRPLSRPRAGAHRGTAGMSALFWVVILGSALGYGQYRLATTPGSLRPGPRLAVVQTNVTQDNKIYPTPQQAAADWRRLVELTREAGQSQPRPDLILWPETVVPAALNPEALAHYRQADSQARGDEIFHEQIQHLARDLGVFLLVGAPAYYQWQTFRSAEGWDFEMPTRRYNAALLYGPDGSQIPGVYAKIHRVPFGEYIPWVEQWPWLKRQFIRYFSPYGFDYTLQPGQNYFMDSFVLPGPAQGLGGDGRAAAVHLATPICFEDAVPRATRRMIYDHGRKRGDVLLNLTNDGWYAGSLWPVSAPAAGAGWGERLWRTPLHGLSQSWFLAQHQQIQHMQIAVLRCIEARVPMARSVNTGLSGFISSTGNVGPVVESSSRLLQVEGWSVHQVELDHRSTLYGIVGHGPMTILTLATGVLALAGFWRKRK